MLDRQSLLDLSRYRNRDEPVISLYLEVDRNSPEDKHLIHLKNLVADAETMKEDYAPEVWQGVEQNLERIRTWVRDGEVRTGQGVAIFASGDALWRAFSVPYELPTEILLDDRPRLRPLFRLLQRFERYLAILSDARDARVFVVTPAETREVAQVEDDTPGRHDQGGWSQARLQRHQEKMVEEHLENAAELAFHLFQKQGFDGVVLMGTEDRTHKLLDHLHPYLRQRVLARVPMDMGANEQLVGETALELARTRRRERQSELVDEWEGAVKSGNGLGASGLEETLRAAQQGQLLALIMGEEVHAEGGKCQQCGALTHKPEGECDYCTGPLRHLPDVTEALTSTAIGQGAELIFLATDGQGHRLANSDGIGAILRYAIS